MKNTKVAPGKSTDEKLKILLDWKRSYINAIINALKPAGKVLEIGFGVGFGTQCIHSFHPKNHTIIESNPEVLEEAIKWARQNPNAKVFQGDWKAILPSLGKFDAIFFNDYPLEDDRAIMNFLFPEEFAQTSAKVKDLLSQLEKEMSLVKKQFPDEEIEDFYQKIGRFNADELPQFFLKLKDNGNITKAQYDKLKKKYHLANGKEKDKASKQKTVSKTPSARETGEPKKRDPMLECLEECLKGHMDKGSRFSGFLNGQLSKYEDSQFFDKIITNPNVDYKETSVAIKMSDKDREGIVMIAEKC